MSLFYVRSQLFYNVALGIRAMPTAGKANAQGRCCVNGKIDTPNP
ncbi:MAG: hypothetical protein V7K42_22540 [Nostoc sp.]